MLKNWNISNEFAFSDLFGYSGLSDISPIKSLNVFNEVNFSGSFFNCSNLTDISPLKD